MDIKGIFIVMMDVAPNLEDDWNEWYDAHHVPDRLQVPGFLHGRRFRSIEGSPKYQTIYDIGDLDVLSSPAYVAWRQKEQSYPQDSFELEMERSRTKFPNFSRGLYEMIYPKPGEYQVPGTEYTLLLGFDPPVDKEEEFNVWYDSEHIHAAKRIPGIIAVRRLRAVPNPKLVLRSGVLAGPKYLTIYDLENKEVLQSPAVKEWESPWTSWVRTWYNRHLRILAQRILSMKSTIN